MEKKFKIGDTVKVIGGGYLITINGSIGHVVEHGWGTCKFKEVMVKFDYIPDNTLYVGQEFPIYVHKLELVDSDIKNDNYLF